MGETVTLTAGQHVMHDDAIAHRERAAVQAFLYSSMEWTLTEYMAGGDLSTVSTDQLVKRVEQLRAVAAGFDGDGAGIADVERAIGRLTLLIMSRVELFA